MKHHSITVRSAGPAEGSPNGGSRVIRFLGSTETVARDGGILKQAGWMLDGYRSNPVFLWAHDQKAPPVGRAVAVRQAPEGLVFDIEFPTAEVYPFGELVGRLYEAGFMKAVSVGFRVLEERPPTSSERAIGAEWVATSQELLELSAVPVGADSSALKAARFSDEDAVLARSMGLLPEMQVAVDVVRAEPDEVDLTPTDGMKQEAQRYRDWKAEGRQGGTEVAARRASQILSGEPMPEDAVVAMNAWFARHEVDKQGEGFSPGEPGYPSPGRVAWAAWGGDAGQSWAADKVASLERGARPYDASGKKIKNPTQEEIEEYEKQKSKREMDLESVVERLDAMLARLEQLFGGEDESPPAEGSPDAAADLASESSSPVASQRAEAVTDPYDILTKLRRLAGRKD